jgi:hypothetical protein
MFYVSIYFLCEQTTKETFKFFLFSASCEGVCFFAGPDPSYTLQSVCISISLLNDLFSIRFHSND